MNPAEQMVTSQSLGPLASQAASFSERLLAARRARGRTQKQLAGEHSVDPSTIKDWESGRHKPSHENEKLLAKLIGGAQGFELVLQTLPELIYYCGIMATSKKEASKAGKDLRNPKTPKVDRGPIASDLAQTPRKKK